MGRVSGVSRRSPKPTSQMVKFKGLGKASKIQKLIDKSANDSRTPSVKTLARFVDTSLHYKDVPFQSATSTFAAPGIAWITNIDEGTSESKRIGQHIKLNNIYARGSLKMKVGSTVTTTTGRLIILIDKECNGALPTLAQIVDDTGYLYSPINNDNLERFVVLADKFYNFDIYHNSYNFKRYVNFVLDVHYSGNAGSIVDARENNIFVVWWPNTNTAGDLPVFDMNFRLRFAP